VQNYVPDPGKVEQALRNAEYIENYSKRTLVYGLISSSDASSGIKMVGVQPDKEKKITDINTMVVEGEYLSGKAREIVLGKKLAEKLEVGLGDKLVGVAADLDGNVANELFRVVGIYKSGNSGFDRMHVYVPLKTAQDMLSLGENVSQFAMITNNPQKVSKFKHDLAAGLGAEYEVLTFEDLLPMIMNYIKIYREMIYFIYVIIGIAVLFGIVNTMLMSVFERIQEFGVLKSIGMKNGKLFMMVVVEAFVLGVIGSIVGVIIGLAIYYPLSVYGIDFSIYSESLESFGIGAVMYPSLDFSIVFKSLITMPIATVVGAVYPSIKAIRLNPTDAMRYV
jgi:ABC-type lipoprotein release transport system permease subunit